MAYYVTLKEKNYYRVLDITKANIFTKLSNYKQEGACSLKEIDSLTTQFNDEADLKLYLFGQNILNSDDINKIMSVRRKNNGKYNKVMYDMLFQDDMSLLFPLELTNVIMNRSYNYDFLEAFVKRFYDYYDCRVTINELGCYVNDSMRTNFRNKYLDERLQEVIDKLLYDYNGNLKYLNLHTMAAFVKNYDKKEKEIVKPKVKKKSKIIEGQTSLFD